MPFADADTLRMYLGERIPPNGSAADTFFDDDELEQLLVASPTGEILGAAALGWGVKAGEYARLIDMTESGADRRLSQKYRQAMSMVQYYQGLADKEVANRTTSGRVVGRSISWASSGNDRRIVLYRKMYNRMPILDGMAVSSAAVEEVVEAMYDRPN